MWYFYHVTGLGYDFPLLLFMFWINSLLIKYFVLFSFLPFCSGERSPVSRYHNCYNSFYHGKSLSKVPLTTHSPPSQTLASHLLADTTLLRLFTARFLYYINSVLRQLAFF